MRLRPMGRHRSVLSSKRQAGWDKGGNHSLGLAGNRENRTNALYHRARLTRPATRPGNASPARPFLEALGRDAPKGRIARSSEAHGLCRLLRPGRRLRAFARRHGIVMVFLSQFDRSYDPTLKPCDLADIRLPDPLDPRLFDKTCFMQGDQIRFAAST